MTSGLGICCGCCAVLPLDDLENASPGWPELLRCKDQRACYARWRRRRRAGGSQ